MAAVTRGEAAEVLVADRLRAVLPSDVAVLPNVHWLSRDHGGVREGEADIVVGDPDRGILVLEVKAGAIRRDSDGGWWAGPNLLARSPFVQASESRHALVKKLHEMQAWQAGRKPMNGHGVAFPDVDLDTMRGRLGLDVLGPDADPVLIADQSSFADFDHGRIELKGFVDRAFDHWSGAAGTYPPGRDGIDLLVATMVEPFEIRSMLRYEIDAGEPQVVALTAGQHQLLSTLRGVRRAAIVWAQERARPCSLPRRRGVWPGRGSQRCSSVSTHR